MPWLVLIVDDNAFIRSGVRRLFEDESDFEVSGEAEHGAEAVEKAAALKPHLIVLDFSMPIMNGLTAAPILRERLPEVVIIMLTMFTGDEVETSARKAGVHALVPKHHAASDLIPTARALFSKRPTPNGESAAA
jgi:DNA-binding NarL/FixJ family response regulator